MRVLRQLADQQAMARVSLAAVSAQQAVERSGKDVLTYALVLADRPNLGHILQSGNRAALLRESASVTHGEGWPTARIPRDV